LIYIFEPQKKQENTKENNQGYFLAIKNANSNINFMLCIKPHVFFCHFVVKSGNL